MPKHAKVKDSQKILQSLMEDSKWMIITVQYYARSKEK